VVKKRRFSLSTNILLGMVLGIGCGLFFGESCAKLDIVGRAFIHLLQMSILPYIVVSLIAGIGKMSYTHAKLVAIRGGAVMLVLWGISFCVILAMGMAFPKMLSASFFSSSDLARGESVDFLSLYIPANPFRSLADTVVPAVVLFSIAVGAALIGIKKKDLLIDVLSTLSEALTRVARFVVKLTPIGVFAISASAAGVMTLEEIGRLQAFLITLIVAAILLSFWILPMLIVAVTPFRYRDIVGMSRDALVTAFTTGSLFIVLPILIENCKTLLAKESAGDERANDTVDILIPISFNFPTVGKLLALIFILFGAWLSDSSLTATQYPIFVFSGLLSLFAGQSVALPFMLDSMQLPADLYQLFVIARVVSGRFTTLVAAMGLLTFTLITTSAICGMWRFSAPRFIRYVGISVALLIGTVLATRTILSQTVGTSYNKDEVVLAMQLLENPAPAVVHETVPPKAKPRPGPDRLANIRETGILRLGYIKDRLPFSYFNSAGDLVGLDIELAHRLARDMGVRIEFFPTGPDRVKEDLERGLIDIAMAVLPITPEWSERVTLSESLVDLTVGLVVKDHRRHEFQDLAELGRGEGLRIGVTDRGFFKQRFREILPEAEFVVVGSVRGFFESKRGDIDCLLTAAEYGAAWTLLHPQYTVVVPKPLRMRAPIGYALAPGDERLRMYFDNWLELQRKTGTFDEIFEHWVHGKGAERREPRWSVIRDVLGWVD
jgi:Na+/H+-dicarboxylate symporter